jgi:anaerobic ribonucleoside-triphosphate reductase
MLNVTICDECGEYGKVERNDGWHCIECGSGERVIDDE